MLTNIKHIYIYIYILRLVKVSIYFGSEFSRRRVAPEKIHQDATDLMLPASLKDPAGTPGRSGHLFWEVSMP